MLDREEVVEDRNSASVKQRMKKTHILVQKGSMISLWLEIELNKSLPSLFHIP